MLLFSFCINLIGLSSSIKEITIWAPNPVTGVLRKGSLRDQTFEYESSQDMCLTEHQVWWAAYEPIRRDLSVLRMRKILGPKVPLTPLQEFQVYAVAPVQSYGAWMGGSNTAVSSNMGFDTGRLKKSHYCTSACEDIRSNLELFIHPRVEQSRSRQVRFKWPFSMKCPNKKWAVIEYAMDDRPPLTQQELDQERILYETNEKFRPESQFPDYKSIIEPERRFGEPVRRCICVDEDEYAIRLMMQSSTTCGDATVFDDIQQGQFDDFIFAPILVSHSLGHQKADEALI